MNTQRPLVLSVLAVGLLTLTGCATFVKEGATDAEKEQASQECLDYVTEGFSGLTAALMAKGAYGPIQIIECMKSKGWRYTDGTPIAKQK